MASSSTSTTTNGHEKSPTNSSTDAHSFKRMFIGPMLESDVSRLAATINFSPDLDDLESAGLTRFIYQNAKEFFLRHGGREEDWGEATEYRESELVLTKWLASEWGRIYRSIRRKKSHQSKGLLKSGPNFQPWTNFTWVGDSFEVGDFMGVNVLTKTLSRSPRSQRTNHSSNLIRTLSKFSDTSGILSAPPSPSPLPKSLRKDKQKAFSQLDSNSNVSSYMTARSNVSPSTQNITNLVPPSTDHINELPLAMHDDSTTSNTPLLPTTPPRSKLQLPPDRLNPGSISPNTKKDRSVYFSIPESPTAQARKSSKGKGRETAEIGAISGSNDRVGVMIDEIEPAPPDEVLARTGSQIEEASAGAVIDNSQSLTEHLGKDGKPAVVLRDRMLVRISLAVKGNVGQYFTEDESRSTRGIIYRDLTEFLVVFRDKSVELYIDYKLPFKEHILGHKRLAYMIPLLSNATRLSPFSSVDNSFCLVYTPKRLKEDKMQVQRRSLRFFARAEVSYIFIFRPKTRSSGIDWMWRLWSNLDGKLPQSILIHNPLLENSVEIPLSSSSSNNNTVYDNFTKTSLIDTSLRILDTSPHWKNILSLLLMKEKDFELCWRTESKVDWVWLESDVNGKRRDWAVLFGLALKIPRHPSYLELRVAEHYHTHIILRDGSYFHEPSAIEGYLYRIGLNSSKSLLYLTTHDSYLFFLRPSLAHPPEPPGIVAAAVGAENDDDTDFAAEKMQRSEIKRGRRQILSCVNFLDLRDIVAIRRSSQSIAIDEKVEDIRSHLGRSRNSVLRDLERLLHFADVETDNDGDDPGGDDYLYQTTDKAMLRMRRSFELILRSGHVFKFETHSCKHAIEWVNRLRQLVFYWMIRCRDDAEVEMEIVRSSKGGESHAALINRLKRPTPPPPPDITHGSYLLGRYWHRCVLDGCRLIVKSGPVYVKTKFRAQYQYAHFFLISDHLVQFHVTRQRHQQHRRVEIIDLLDMYVCSGHYAALSLPIEEYRPDAPPVSKFYQDGLESSDTYEDTFFALWYRRNRRSGDVNGMSDKFPNLSGQKKLLICRVRSNLERDAWCWALNCEIEKLSRK